VLYAFAGETDHVASMRALESLPKGEFKISIEAIYKNVLNKPDSPQVCEEEEEYGLAAW
jgi:hypothetical protein